jgi:PPM family protein phosphatase
LRQALVSVAEFSAIFEMAPTAMIVKPGMEVAHRTHVGLQRANNEDSFIYWEAESDEEFRRKGRLAVIADGMGGYEGGQEASRIAVQTVQQIYERFLSQDAQTVLLEAFAEAHRRILEHASKHAELRSMGTTCTALAVIGSQLFFAHIGDSRLYLVRGTSATRLTRDHSYVSQLVESGFVRAEDAERHPQRHILTAALGSGREVAADKPDSGVKLEKGDTLVLCTDGLWSQVRDEEMVGAIRGNNTVEACTLLMDLALERGGPDNITLQLLRVAE